MSTDTVESTAAPIYVDRENVRASASIRTEWAAIKALNLSPAEQEREERRVRREYGSKSREVFMVDGPGGVRIRVPRAKAMFMVDLREARIVG